MSDGLTDWMTIQPTNQPTNQLTNQPTNQLTNQSTNQPTNQPINQPTNQPTNFLTNTSWEAYRFWAIQEILLFVTKTECPLSCSKSRLLVPILSYMNPVHAVPSTSFKIHFNIIFLSTPRS